MFIKIEWQQFKATNTTIAAISIFWAVGSGKNQNNFIVKVEKNHCDNI